MGGWVDGWMFLLVPIEPIPVAKPAQQFGHALKIFRFYYTVQTMNF